MRAMETTSPVSLNAGEEVALVAHTVSMDQSSLEKVECSHLSVPFDRSAQERWCWATGALCESAFGNIKGDEMRSRAIRDLSQLSDSDFFVEAAEGLELVIANARRIYASAITLGETKHYHGAQVL